MVCLVTAYMNTSLAHCIAIECAEMQKPYEEYRLHSRQRGCNVLPEKEYLHIEKVFLKHIRKNRPDLMPLYGLK